MEVQFRPLFLVESLLLSARLPDGHQVLVERQGTGPRSRRRGVQARLAAQPAHGVTRARWAEPLPLDRRAPGVAEQPLASS